MASQQPAFELLELPPLLPAHHVQHICTILRLKIKREVVGSFSYHLLFTAQIRALDMKSGNGIQE